MTAHQILAWARPRKAAMGDVPFELTWSQKHGYHEFEMCLVIEPWSDAIVWRVTCGIIRGKFKGGTPRPYATWTNMQRKYAEYVCEETLEGVGDLEIIRNEDENSLTLRKRLSGQETEQLQARYTRLPQSVDVG